MKIILILLLNCSNNLKHIYKPNNINYSDTNYVDKLTHNRTLEEAINFLNNNQMNKEELKNSFFYAAMISNKDLIEAFLKNGIDVNVKEEGGFGFHKEYNKNALDICLLDLSLFPWDTETNLEDIIDTVTILLNWNINLKYKENTHPLISFVNLVARREIEKKLTYELEEKVKKTVNLFLSKGIDINSDYPDTALAVSIKRGNENTWLSEFLISKGADGSADSKFKGVLSLASKIKNEKARKNNMILVLKNKDRWNLKIQDVFNSLLLEEPFDDKKDALELLLKYVKPDKTSICNCYNLEAFKFVSNNAEMKDLIEIFDWYLESRLIRLKNNKLRKNVNLEYKNQILLETILYSIDLVKAKKPILSLESLRRMDKLNCIFIHSLLDMYHPFTLIKYVADQKEVSLNYIDALENTYDKIEKNKYIDISWYFISNMRLSKNVDTMEKQLDLIYKILDYVKDVEILKKLPRDLLASILRLNKI